MDYIHIILYVLGCILLIGVFTGMDIAFMSVSKINIELRKKQGSLSGRILSKLVDTPGNFLGTTLIAINVLLVIYGLMMTRFNEPLLKLIPHKFQSIYIALFVNVLFASLVLLAFSGMMPKTVFRNKATQMLTIFSIPMLLLYHLLNPIARVFVSISEFILKYLFNVRIKENQAIFNRTDIDLFIKHSLHGHNADKREINADLFENALALVNTRIRKCMIPRNEIEAIPVTATIAEVRERFIKTQLSRIIVYEGSIDNIVGYLHHLDLNRNPENLRDILYAISVVPETMSAVDLLNNFTRERKNIAWVIDEFGGTAGIVTMEDVLERIFGDINDEYDEQVHVEKQIAEHEYIFSGRLNLSYLKEKYNFTFFNDRAETLSGYIIDEFGAIPQNKERIIIDKYEFDILLVTNTRIETVKMKVLL